VRCRNIGFTCATSVQIFNFDFTGALTLPNTHDVGLLILDQAINLPEYGQLAPVGTLKSLATSRGTKQTVFTVSGYGLTFKPNPNAPLATISLRERLMAEESPANLSSALNDGFNLQTQGNGNDQGGTCNGDSGGPVFLGPYSSNLVVAVTSFGLNTLCRGTDFAFRVDSAAVQAWMADVLGPTWWNPIGP
jgi:secreted trypsin-like serine protease